MRKTALGFLTWLVLYAAPSRAVDYQVHLGDSCGTGVEACFTPATLAIRPGDSIEFIPYAETMETGPHDIVADDGSFHCLGSACYGFTHVFNSTGVVRYHDAVTHAAGAIVVDTRYASAMEYRSVRGRENYFWTVDPSEIEALDWARINGWLRTGTTVGVAISPDAYAGMLQPVCRFYVPASNSHFLSASREECIKVRESIPGYIFESEAVFYVALPDPDTGECHRGVDINGVDFSVPVFRLWNRSGDSSHQFTTDRRTRDRFARLGYVPEGYGPDGVSFCALSVR